ncbi:uncharacterized protein V6R79_016300 [Siganus canaliculatus]
MSGGLHRDQRAGQVVTQQRVMEAKQKDKRGGAGMGGGDVGGAKAKTVDSEKTTKSLLRNKSRERESKHITESLHQPTSALPKDPDLVSYVLPSHPDTLFTGLRSLRDEGLLLDCTFPLRGCSVQAHRLVLAATSENPDAFFESKSKFELQMQKSTQDLSPDGLRALLDFAYCGDVGSDLSEGGVMEGLPSACQCLQMERLMRRCTSSSVTASASTEREQSLSVIADMWERGVGCDVTIKAESGERYLAHRVVLAAGGDYFRALLCGGLRESTEDVVCLRGVSAQVIEAILGFIYTGHLRLAWSLVWELVDALSQFQLQGALSLCIDFLCSRMDEGTCLDVHVLAETHGLVQLGQAAEEYILAHFQSTSAGEKFKDVPCELLARLIEKDTLCVESEILVFRAVVGWVEDNPKERLRLLPGLLHHVRLPLLSYSELQEALSCRLLSRSSGARESLKVLRSLVDGHYRGPECPPRTPNQVLVLVCGDTVDEDFMRRVPSQTLWFARRFHRGPGLIRNIEWRPFAELPEPPRFRHCICFLNNKLYVLGGRRYYGHLDILKSAYRFDLSQCKWERLPDMMQQRDYFAAVCLDGKVFVLGGNGDDTHYLDAVECYVPQENIWRQAHPLDTAVCGHAAAVLDGQIYISGGCDPLQRCLPSMWHYHPSRGCATKAPMTVGTGRAGHIMLALGRGLVVAGGLQPLWMGFGDQLLCEVYDPTQDCWSSIPTLPRPHLSPGATVLDGRLYVVGGSSASTARDSKWVHCYDPVQGQWENLGAMPQPFTDLAACSLPLPGLVNVH